MRQTTSFFVGPFDRGNRSLPTSPVSGTFGTRHETEHGTHFARRTTCIDETRAAISRFRGEGKGENLGEE